MAERLGHSNISVTLNVYAHVSEETHRAAAEAIRARMFGGAGS